MNNPPLNFFGVRVVENALCTERVPNFPESKHRSQRLHKKLLKRLGTKEVPTSYMISGSASKHMGFVGDTLVCHPNIKNHIVKILGGE